MVRKCTVERRLRGALRRTTSRPLLLGGSLPLRATEGGSPSKSSGAIQSEPECRRSLYLGIGIASCSLLRMCARPVAPDFLDHLATADVSVRAASAALLVQRASANARHLPRGAGFRAARISQRPKPATAHLSDRTLLPRSRWTLGEFCLLRRGLLRGLGLAPNNQTRYCGRLPLRLPCLLTPEAFRALPAKAALANRLPVG